MADLPHTDYDCEKCGWLNDGPSNGCPACGHGRKKSAAPFWTVAIYLCDRAYGGPEEGGWWFNTGERVDTALDGVPDTMILMVLPTSESAHAWAGFLQGHLDKTVNVGRRDINSVLSEGCYQAHVYNGHPPAFYPERRPHYE